MAFEENSVLFGHDGTERIVAVEPASSKSVRIYSRDPAGRVLSQDEEFRPFLWSCEAVGVENLEQIRLTGELPFSYLVRCDNWAQFTKLRTGLKNTGQKSFSLNDPVQQFLVQTGKTLFKGMQFDELRRLQISTGVFWDGSPDEGQERIAVIALSDNTGWEELLSVDPAGADRSEAAALDRLTAIIAERDPDVIEGHDLFRGILPLIAAGARKQKVKLAWGREKSPLTSRPSRLNIAEKTINYPKFEVYGRHFVDTALLAQFYDVSVRELEGYGLDEVARHFRISGANRGESGTPPPHYLKNAAGFGEWVMEAARQTRKLSALLSGSYFIQARIFPYTYQDVTVRGNATKIDSLLLREYHRRNHSIPDLPVSRAFEGGYTDIFFTGIARGVWHCDVASLYPSIMLQFDCFPAQDQLGVFRGLLRDLRLFRLESKAKMRGLASSAHPEFNYYQALQSTFKILINSFYGYLGFAQAHFADFNAASRVTEIGRGLLKKMVEQLRADGAEVIEIDTDGIYFVPPEGKAIAELQAALEELLPEGIEVEFDARYLAMFSYKAKNYALLTEEGELRLTGGALKSRGLEKFQRVFLEEMIKLLMAGNGANVSALHAEFEAKIRNREWPIEFLMKTETLQDSLPQYVKKVEGSSRNRASAYELALKSKRPYQPGDQVRYYITGTKKNLSAYENSKLASDWDPNARDENVEYYAAKLGELVRKFAPFFPAESASPAGRGSEAAQIELI